MTIGRHEEHEALDAVVVGAAVGRGGTLATVGEAGIGKTRLVEHPALAPGEPYPISWAIVARLAGEAQLRDGWGDPVGMLRRAEAVFDRHGLLRIGAACRGLLRKAGAAAPRRRAADRSLPAPLIAAGVTLREAEVLDLLVDRLTNKEIASRLFCSPRTVEKHVAALILKLGVARAQLAEVGRTMGRDPHDG